MPEHINNFWDFAHYHPILTFFLFCIIGSSIVSIFRAIFGRKDEV